MISNDLFLIILLAAALNAGWNCAIKVSGDRITVMAITTLTGSAFSLFALPLIDMPAIACLPLLALSIAIHTAYHFVLPIAYNHGDLGQIYPIARGSAPLLVTVSAALILGELPQPVVLFGVACLCAGVICLSFDRHRHTKKSKAVPYALLTGVLIAAYTVVDAIGGRLSGSPAGFAVLLTLGDGIATGIIVCLWKGPKALQVSRRTLFLCSTAGAMQIGAYWIAVWALARAPMGIVSALRETSVLFVALISTFVLKEKFGFTRLISAVLVVVGIGVIRFARA